MNAVFAPTKGNGMELDFNTTPLIFNPDGDDTLGARSIIGGSTTNIVNLNNVKYPWAVEHWREMTGNFWLPEKHDLNPDKLQFPDLAKEDAFAQTRTISFLQFLDSVQITNLPNIFNWITSPEVKNLGTVQVFQEAVHTQTYQYILESIFPVSERQNIYYFWREDKLLLERNKHIAQIYQDFQDKPNFFNFYRSLIANLILESIYFYNGFTFFYNMEYRNLQMGSAGLIRLINVDEHIHTKMFANIIKTVHQEIKIDFDWKSLVLEMVDQSIESEITTADILYSDKIVGMSQKTTRDYTRHLGDNTLGLIGMSPVYNTKNPYEYLTSKFGENQSGQRGNFFETNVGEYSMASALTGWDEI